MDSNLGFLQSLLRHPGLANGQVSTSFIDRHAAAGCEVIVVDPDRSNRAAFGQEMAALGYGLTMRTADREAALLLPRADVATSSVAVDDAVQEAIDEELRRKYASNPESVEAMLSDAARSCTLRVEPAR